MEEKTRLLIMYSNNSILLWAQQYNIDLLLCLLQGSLNRYGWQLRIILMQYLKLAFEIQNNLW